MSQKKLLLIILDGWGIGSKNDHNAIYKGNTPFFDHCMDSGSVTTLKAAEEAVGLVHGQIGSSEVGHMHIGAGRIVPGDLKRINDAIDDGSFFENQAFLKVMDRVKRDKSRLHLLGVISDGGVHGHQEHLFALLKMAKDHDVEDVYIHAFSDGRDTPPMSSLNYFPELEKKIQEYGLGKIATLCGRYYSMDRDRNWDRIKKARELLTEGKGKKFSNVMDALRASHKKEIFDEYIEPVVLDKKGCIREKDTVVVCNFRQERPRQIIRTLMKAMPGLNMVTMTRYDMKDFLIKAAYTKPMVDNHVSMVLSQEKVDHLKLAETEKFAHITTFLNGSHQLPYKHEGRIIVPSKEVYSFDQLPEMSAKEITDAAIMSLEMYQVLMINYANADVVGHTGKIEAGIKAVETVDKSLQRLVKKARDRGFDVMITSDHGNAEEMYDAHNDCNHTAHTVNNVPFILLSDKTYSLKDSGGLINVAPTMLELLGLQKPKEMVESLVK